MKFAEFKIKLSFDQRFEFHVRPLYLMRSIMGMSLHALCCSNRGTVCDECSNCAGCLYSEFFEGMRKKDDGNYVRSVHPFSLHLVDRTGGRSIDEFTFLIKVYGNQIENIPYIFASFIRMGAIGAGKEKIKYRAEIIGSESLDADYRERTEQWEENMAYYDPYEGDIKVKLITPLRFKSEGKYRFDFTAEQFMLALRRRYISVIDAFGEQSARREFVSSAHKIVQRDFRWNESGHWSSRQQDSMQLGGVVGSFVMHGSFSAYEMMLLDFASRFSAGKNVSFGLGNIAFERGK